MAQFMFVAGGEACGACSALDGTISDGGIGPQHENCQCQDVPVNMDNDCPTIELGDPHIETTGATFTISAELTVRCCDGSEIGGSYQQDLGPASQDLDIALAGFAEFLEDAGAELVPSCPDSVPVWIEDGDQGGLA